MKGSMITVLMILSGIAHAEKTDLKLTGQQGVHYFFTLSSPWADNPEYIEKVFNSFCSDKEICITHIWKKGEVAPRKLPFTDKEVELELATLQHNKHSGKNELLWNCKRFKTKKLKNCF